MRIAKICKPLAFCAFFAGIAVSTMCCADDVKPSTASTQQSSVLQGEVTKYTWRHSKIYPNLARLVGLCAQTIRPSLTCRCDDLLRRRSDD